MKTQTLLSLALLAATPFAAHAQGTIPSGGTIPVIVTPAAGTAQPVTLRFKFTPGQTLYYTLTVDTDGTITNPMTQAPMPLKNHIQALLHQTVKDVRAADGAATVQTGVDTMTFSMNGQEFPMPPERLAAMKTVGTTVMLPSGKVLSFTPAASGGSAMPGMDFGHANALSVLGALPDAPLKVGDTWKSDVAASLTGAQIASGFTLSGVDTANGKTVAVIGQTTDGRLATPSATPAVPASVGGNIKGTGQIRFDVGAGALESLTNAADMTLTMTPPGATSAMTIGMKVTTTMKRVEVPVSGAAKAP